MPSLKALTNVALYCPTLQMLGLHFDAASWYDDADWEDVPQEHYLGSLAHRSSRSRVYSLSVSTSPIEGQSQVAYFLARTFPQLCELFTVHEPWDEEEEEEERMVIRKRWEEVARYIPLFAHIRLDERRRFKLDAGGKDDEEGDEEDGDDEADGVTDEGSLEDQA